MVRKHQFRRLTDATAGIEKNHCRTRTVGSSYSVLAVLLRNHGIVVFIVLAVPEENRRQYVFSPIYSSKSQVKIEQLIVRSKSSSLGWWRSVFQKGEGRF